MFAYSRQMLGVKLIKIKHFNQMSGCKLDFVQLCETQIEGI